jgi:hypothetical protein
MFRTTMDPRLFGSPGLTIGICIGNTGTYLDPETTKRTKMNSEPDA